MRDLKFMAKNKVGNWVYVSIWDMNPPLSRENFTNVCEFTGLYDKNGDEIYEGHILRYDNPEYKLGHETPYVIKWNSEEACFECVNRSNYMMADIWKEMVIIGNFVDNPELIE